MSNLKVTENVGPAKSNLPDKFWTLLESLLEASYDYGIVNKEWYYDEAGKLDVVNAERKYIVAKQQLEDWVENNLQPAPEFYDPRTSSTTESAKS